MSREGRGLRAPNRKQPIRRRSSCSSPIGCFHIEDLEASCSTCSFVASAVVPRQLSQAWKSYVTCSKFEHGPINKCWVTCRSTGTWSYISAPVRSPHWSVSGHNMFKLKKEPWKIQIYFCIVTRAQKHAIYHNLSHISPGSLWCPLPLVTTGAWWMYRTVHRPRVAIRAKPSTQAEIVHVLAAGEIFRATQRWREVGWRSWRFLKMTFLHR